MQSNVCFITARKQSLGQGNAFTGVCLSTGGLCMMSLPILLPGPMFCGVGGTGPCSFQESLVHVPSRGSLPRGHSLGGSLMRAVSTGMVSCCQLLLKAGADVNAQDKHGKTPLIYAANW